MNANSSKNITLYDPPRTADDDVEFAEGEVLGDD